MTDSVILNLLILAFVFIAGACVGAAVVIQKALHYARKLYAPRKSNSQHRLTFLNGPMPTVQHAIMVSGERINEIGYENARREAVERAARLN